MPFSPDLSIILPVFNSAATLPECIHSIQRQSLHNYEVLAIDDGSQDDSAAILRRWAREDPRIRLLQPGRIGLCNALNLGLQEATSPIIARMDADDRMHPRRLEKQYRYLQSRPEVALVATQARLFAEQPLQAGYREYMRWQNRLLEPVEIANNIYVECPFVHPTTMFRRQTILHLGGYRKGEFPEDYDLWLRMARGQQPMGKIGEVLLEWRESPGRLSRTDPRCSREAFDRLRAHHLAQDIRLHRGRDIVYWGAGRKTRRRARHLIEQGFPPAAWIDIDPNKIGNRVQGAEVRPPDWLRQDSRPFVLSYVSNHGARELIATTLEHMGFRCGDDYLMVG